MKVTIEITAAGWTTKVTSESGEVLYEQTVRMNASYASCQASVKLPRALIHLGDAIDDLQLCEIAQELAEVDQPEPT